VTLGKGFAECPINSTQQKPLCREKIRQEWFAECKRGFAECQPSSSSEPGERKKCDRFSLFKQLRACPTDGLNHFVNPNIAIMRKKSPPTDMLCEFVR